MSFREKLQNKAIYLGCLSGMCILLVGVAYFFFLRSYEINMTQGMELVYSGENGAASVEAVLETGNLNQRTQEFMDSVSYTITPNTDLANGDTITIVANYDEELAVRYHFKPVNTKTKVVVSGLYDRYEDVTGLSEAYLSDIDDAAGKWLIKNEKSIFRMIYGLTPASVQMDSQVVYSAFLKSRTDANRDMVVSIYELDFAYDEQEYTVYYLVCVPGINSSDTVDETAIYGEKAYLTDEQIEKRSFAAYISRLYSSKYEIDLIYEEPEPQEEEEEQEETEENTPSETEETIDSQDSVEETAG